MSKSHFSKLVEIFPFKPQIVIFLTFCFPMFLFTTIFYSEFNSRVKFFLLIGSLWSFIGPYFSYKYENNVLLEYWVSLEDNLADQTFQSLKFELTYFLVKITTVCSIISVLFFEIIYNFGGYSNLGKIYYFGQIIVILISPIIGHGIACFIHMIFSVYKVSNYYQNLFIKVDSHPDILFESELHSPIVIKSVLFFGSGLLIVPLGFETIIDFNSGYEILSIGFIMLFISLPMISFLIPYISLAEYIKVSSIHYYSKIKIFIMLSYILLQLFISKNTNKQEMKFSKLYTNSQLLEVAIDWLIDRTKFGEKRLRKEEIVKILEKKAEKKFN